MNLEQLRTFREVAIRGGFGRAAQALYLTQSAVSMQIAALERELGVRLFERQGRHIALTEAGQVLLGYATHITTLTEECKRAIDQTRPGVTSLVVGTSPTVGNYVLPDFLGPEVLARFRAQHPGVRVALEVAPSPQIAWRLVTGSLDVGLVEGPVMAPELTQQPFLIDTLALIVPPGHRWVGRDGVDPQELAAEPFVVFERGSGVRQIVDARLGERGVHLRPVLEVASPETIKAAVRAGLGVSIVPTRTARLELTAGVLHAIPLRSISLEQQIRIVRRADRPASPALEDFLLLFDRQAAPSISQA